MARTAKKEKSGTATTKYVRQLDMIELLQAIDRSLEAHLSSLMASSGVTAKQFVFLRRIAANPGITAARLGKLLYMDKSSVSRGLKRMEQANLIARSKPSGRAGKLILITAEGEKRLTQARPVWEAKERALKEPLRRFRVLGRLLKKVLHM